jgi:hypothetical protein
VKRKPTRKTIVVLVSLGIVGFGLLKSIPYFIDREAIKLEIEKGLHESTGVNFKIHELQLVPTIFHGIQVHLNTSTITDIKHQPLGSINNITVQIRYLPLLTQQLPEIAKIHLDDVVIPVGKSNFFKELHLKLTKPKRTGWLKPAEMHDTEVLLTDYQIEDTVLSRQVLHLLPAAQGFSLRGNKLSLKHLESKKPVSLMADGIMSFIPENVWLAHAAARLKGNKAKTSEAMHYQLMLEVPQAVIKKGKMDASGLQRLELSLKGGRQDLNVSYRLGKDVPGQPTRGTAQVRSPGLELLRGQVLAIQLWDTFAIPIPPALLQTVVAGNLKLDNRFDLRFPAGRQPELVGGNGYITLGRLGMAPYAQPSRPWLDSLSGTVNLKSQTVSLDRMTFKLAGLPLSLNGWYRLDNQQVNAHLTGKNLREDSLTASAHRLGTSTAALQGLNLQGVLDVDATLTGTLNQPSYRGTVAMRNGAFQDQSRGLEANHLTGQIRFSGYGLKKPVVNYQGNLNVADGHFADAQQGINVRHFDGKVAFNGQYTPGPPGAMPPLPHYTGQIDVREAEYKDPKTDLLVSGIRGVIRLGQDLIRLENFRALFAGSTYTASGQLKQDLSAYHLNVRGDRIDLPRLKEAVAPKFPEAKQALAHLDPYSGQARLNLNIDTGMKMNGRLDITELAAHTGQKDYPFQVPRMSVLFQNQQVTLARTAIYVGSVPVQLDGTANLNGRYNLNVASGDVPLSAVRDAEPLIESLTGQDLPEIWNTAGSMRVQGKLANQNNRFQLEFQNAGLSWQGGDFPLYDLNGGLSFQQVGHNPPVIASRNLNFRYGNSPVALSLDSHGRLNAVFEGVLSGLTVNHFLVSRQSEATPYQNIPFQASMNGMLAALPGPGADADRAGRRALAKNDVRAFLHLNLDQNFRQAYEGVTPKPEQPASGQPTGKPAEQASQPAAGTEEAVAGDGVSPGSVIGKLGKPILHPVRTVGHVLGTARQTVQSGLDALITTTKATANLLPSREASNGENGSANGLPGPASLIRPGDTGASYLSAGLHWAGPDLQLEQALLHLFDAGDLVAEGRVENFMDPSKLVFLAHLSSQPGIDLSKLSQGANSNLFFRDAKGQVALDVQVVGNSEGPKLASGWASSTHMAIPYLTLRDLTGRVTLDGETAQATVEALEIPGVSASATARTANIFEVPTHLEDVKIHGRMLSIESLGNFLDQVVEPILVEQLAHNYLRPWQQGDPAFPIQFRNGDLQVDEVIYQNIILNSLSSKFSLYANSFFELSNTKVEAAGGLARGYLSMNPNDASFTTLDMNVENVKANALTKALLNVTNQIFGDVDGTVRFTTYGNDPIEMQKNANGTVSMRVKNGRLPAIAKVETLLTTANIIRGGVLGLNLNNLLRSLTIYDTNYFATLSGDMLINDQVLYTRNLSSLGVNLDLLIRGSIKMDNGLANLTVDGRMKQIVAGKLGALGKLSLGGLVSRIPALGTFGNNRTGLLGYIPGVGWVPGFGGPAGDVNRFRVRLVGDLNNPGAIQDFRWVH